MRSTDSLTGYPFIPPKCLVSQRNHPLILLYHLRIFNSYPEVPGVLISP